MPPQGPPSMMGFPDPMAVRSMHPGGSHMSGFPDTLAAVTMSHGGAGRSMMGMSTQTIYPSMMGSPPAVSQHHTMNRQFSPPPPPPFPASRSPVQQHSMVILPNRTIHHTYGSVMPHNPTNQMYNDLPIDARTIQAEMIYNPTMPHQEAPGQLKTLNELAGQTASNRSYAYGMQQYGPVSVSKPFQIAYTSMPAYLAFQR